MSKRNGFFAFEPSRPRLLHPSRRGIVVFCLLGLGACNTGVFAGNDCVDAAQRLASKLQSCGLSQPSAATASGAGGAAPVCPPDEGQRAKAIADCTDAATCEAVIGTDRAGALQLAQCVAAAQQMTSSTGLGGVGASSSTGAPKSIGPCNICGTCNNSDVQCNFPEFGTDIRVNKAMPYWCVTKGCTFIEAASASDPTLVNNCGSVIHQLCQ